VRIKSYFAKTITEAMERARTELGDDAMIIASHKTSGEAQRLGVYEVVFGLAGPVAAKPEAVEAAAPVVPEPREGLVRLRTRMEDLRQSVSRKREQAAQASQSRVPFAARAGAVLMQAGFPKAFAEEIATGIQSRSRIDQQDMVGAIRTELTARLRVAPKLGVSGRGRSISAVVGPAGVGKTSIIVKLAVKHGLAAGRPVRLVSTDTHRLGGSDMLRRYAEAMGVRFESPTNIEALERILMSAEPNAVMLLDTEGAGPSVNERSAALASFFAQRADIDIHLALPAYASYAGLGFMAAQFKTFLPSKMIFTGLDTCLNVGPLLAYTLETELAVSFLGVGPEVPDHLEDASTAGLTARLLPALVAAAAQAA
jgi:flagellar biosynthesis protein FlhF